MRVCKRLSELQNARSSVCRTHEFAAHHHRPASTNGFRAKIYYANDGLWETMSAKMCEMCAASGVRALPANLMQPSASMYTPDGKVEAA